MPASSTLPPRVEGESFEHNDLQHEGLVRLIFGSCMSSYNNLSCRNVPVQLYYLFIFSKVPLCLEMRTVFCGHPFQVSGWYIVHVHVELYRVPGYQYCESEIIMIPYIAEWKIQLNETIYMYSV